MLVPGIPDVLGGILGIADMIGKFTKDDDDYHSAPEVVDRTPVIVQQPPSTPSNTDQVVNINLTLNIYSKDGELMMTSKKDETL